MFAGATFITLMHSKLRPIRGAFVSGRPLPAERVAARASWPGRHWQLAELIEELAWHRRNN